MMEIFVLFVAIGAFLILISVREGWQAKRREKAFIASLYHLSEKQPDREYSLERYARIGSFYRKHIKSGQVDDITWNDLSMDELFKRMNYTFSASGEEYLYYTLRDTGRSVAQLDHLEEIISFFAENQDVRVKIQYCMKQLGHTGKYSLYDYLDNLSLLGERSNKKDIVVNLLYLPMAAVIFFQLPLGLTGLAVLLIYNILTYFKEKSVIEPYIASFAYINRLLVCCDELSKIFVPICESEWTAMKQNLKKLKGVRDGSFWVFTSNQGLTSGNPLDILMDYAKMIFHIDLIQFNRMLKQLRSHMAEVEVLLETVGYVETTIAVGLFRDSIGEYCIPQFAGNFMKFYKGYHPLLQHPVKNSIAAERGVLLTGSNASGKSTFLKTVAVNAIMAQTIHTCCGSEYTAPLYDIYSSMALRDDIGSGESYYIVEIKALKRILDAADGKRHVLCFVDEVLRGTNTVERIAASTQILKSLAKTSGVLCFAATHDIELTELLKEFYDNYHFEEEIIEGDIFFPYKLIEGPTTTRNAIRLLEMLGYEGEVIEKAQRQAEVFVRTGCWELG